MYLSIKQFISIKSANRKIRFFVHSRNTPSEGLCQKMNHNYNIDDYCNMVCRKYNKTLAFINDTQS